MKLPFIVFCALPAAWLGTAAPARAQQSKQYLHPAADPAHRLTGSEFLHDLGGNFTGIFSTRNIAPALAWTAAYGVATAPEQDIERHFAPGGVWGNWPVPGRYIGSIAVLGPASFALYWASRKSDSRRFRSMSYSMVHAMITSVAIQIPAKAAFHRLRPNQEDHRSFPSGHSQDSFAAATVLSNHYGWKAALPAYAIASYVAASRLADRKHHLTDVVGGAAIGHIIGRTVSHRMTKGKPSRVSWSVMPMRGGAAASLSIALP